MKKLQYILLACVVLLVGCEDPIESDQHLIDNFDHTGPAYVMMSHGMKVLAAASGTLVRATNLNEWLTAEGEDAKLAIEDKYYPYLKIREVEENLWKIYNEKYTESYLLNEGLMLNQVGAEWIVYQSSPFFNPSEINPTISCVGDDSYDVTFDNTSINFSSNATLGLAGYLTNWSSYTEGMVDANLTIRTNNQAFRSGEEDMLKFSISGEARIHNRSEYGLQITIDEPIEMCFGTDGNMAKGTIGVGVVTMKNTVTLESVRVTLSHYNTIYLEYKHSGGGTIAGYYDWAGNILTPR